MVVIWNVFCKNSKAVFRLLLSLRTNTMHCTAVVAIHVIWSKQGRIKTQGARRDLCQIISCIFCVQRGRYEWSICCGGNIFHNQSAGKNPDPRRSGRRVNLSAVGITVTFHRLIRCIVSNVAAPQIVIVMTRVCMCCCYCLAFNGRCTFRPVAMNTESKR